MSRTCGKTTRRTWRSAERRRSKRRVRRSRCRLIQREEEATTFSIRSWQSTVTYVASQQDLFSESPTPPSRPGLQRGRVRFRYLFRRPCPVLLLLRPAGASRLQLRPPLLSLPMGASLHRCSRRQERCRACLSELPAAAPFATAVRSSVPRW